MALGNRLTEDDLRQRAQTSRMMALYSPAQRRESAARTPSPPGGTPVLEQVRPSTAPATAAVVGGASAIAGTALGLINPLLGMFVGLFGNIAAQAVSSNIARDESAEAAQVAHRNRRALGQAQREQQQYSRDLVESQRPLTSPGPVMPQATQGPEGVDPGAVRRQQSILMG